MKSTKQQSYEATQPTIGAKAMLVYDTLKNSQHPLSRAQLAATTGLKLSSVCARVNELIEASMVKVDGTTFDFETQRNVQTLVAV